MLLYKRLYSAWKRHGTVGFIRLLGKNIDYHLRALYSRRLCIEELDSDFDRVHGTDTESIREIGSLDLPIESGRDAVRYQPSPTDLVRETILGLPIDPSRFTFIDFGAGKGRVLMIAAELPFHAVIGIELSGELCEIANSNIARIDAARYKAGQVKCEHADVTAYPLPDTPLVCYFYNPFGATTMQQVIMRLAATLHDHPREIYVIYIHPEHSHLFEAAKVWETQQQGEFHVIYRNRPTQASA